MTMQKISTQQYYRTMFIIISGAAIGLIIVFLFLIYFQPNIIIKAIAYQFKDEPILFYPDAYYSSDGTDGNKMSKQLDQKHMNPPTPNPPRLTNNVPFLHRSLSSIDEEFKGKFYEENEKVVALTIDDGLSSYTNEILNVLDKYNSQATFFLIGKHLERYNNSLEIIDKMLENGNELGNHMWRDEPSINLEFNEFEQQLLKVDQIINQSYNRYYNRKSKELLLNIPNNNQINQQDQEDNNNNNNNSNNQLEIKKYLNYCKNASSEYQLYQHLLDDEPISTNTKFKTSVNSQHTLVDNNILSKCNIRKRKLFRPGSGFFNREMLEIIKRHEYILCLGNIYPHDPFITIPSINSWHVLTNISPGSVIILHDREHTIETLNTILPKLISDGYKITTLSNLLDKENLFMKK